MNGNKNASLSLSTCPSLNDQVKETRERKTKKKRMKSIDNIYLYYILHLPKLMLLKKAQKRIKTCLSKKYLITKKTTFKNIYCVSITNLKKNIC